MRRSLAFSLVIPAAALALASCSGGEEDASAPASGEGLSLEEAQAELSEMEQPRPGQYSQEATIRTIEVGQLPQDMVAQMEDMFESQMTRSYCLTAEEAEKGFEEMYRQVTQEQDCDYEKFDVDGGKVSAVLACKGDEGMVLRMTIDGTSTETSSQMDMTMSTTGGPMQMNIDMGITSRRTGDCEA